jgi:hypothetical protein
MIFLMMLLMRVGEMKQNANVILYSGFL